MGGSKKHAVSKTSSLLAKVQTNPEVKKVVPTEAPIVSSYNDRIRPLLDTVDRLRNLNVMREGIQLPTIVVVGDQSSGKSSVLESLAGISLPRGQGICTRVPLVMRLQRITSPEPEIWLEFGDKVIPTDEEHIAESICAATDVIAGSGKGVSDTPLTLHVKKADVPDLTMVDLPGITRVPVNGQPEDIYEQISGMIMMYIEPQESIILNVLSATVDFTTCESIRMSRQVDKTGVRTLAVVTKADMAPEGLLQKVIFRNHPMLSMIDDGIVGIPVLAHKLMQIQGMMISRCLPQIQSSIKRAGRNLICKMKEQSVDRVVEIVEMEKLTDYTCSPEYMTSWTEKTALQQNFINAVLYDENKPENLSLIGFGDVKISHLRTYHAHLLQQAFDMKMRITSYWTIVLRRIVDNLALHLQFSVKNLVNRQFQKEIVAEMVDPRGGTGGGVHRLLEESPSVASKREKLKNSIKLLNESKDVVAAIVDQNSGYGDR